MIKKKVNKKHEKLFLILTIILFPFGLIAIVINIFNILELGLQWYFIMMIFTSTCVILSMMIYFLGLFFDRSYRYLVTFSYTLYNIPLLLGTSFYYIITIFSIGVSIIFFILTISKKYIKYYLLIYSLLYFIIMVLQSSNIIPVFPFEVKGFQGLNGVDLFFSVICCIFLFSVIMTSILYYLASTNETKMNKIDKFNLTQREKEVLLLLIDGYSYKELAGQLFISIDTVKTHAKNIYRKTNVSSKIELFNLFIDN